MPKIVLRDPRGVHDPLSVYTGIGLIVLDVDTVGHKVFYGEPMFFNKYVLEDELTKEEICDIQWQNVKNWEYTNNCIKVVFNETVSLKDHVGAVDFNGNPIKRIFFNKVNLEMRSF